MSPIGRSMLAACLVAMVAFATAMPVRAKARSTRAVSWEDRPSAIQLRNVERFYQFARCMTARSEAQMRDLVLSSAFSVEESKFGPEMNTDPCLGYATVEMEVVKFKGFFAQAVYMQRPQKILFNENLSRERFLERLILHEKPKSQRLNENRWDREGRWLAYCAVRKNPQTAEALIRTPFGSNAELEKFIELREPLTQCSDGVRHVEWDRMTIRALLAEALVQGTETEATHNA